MLRQLIIITIVSIATQTHAEIMTVEDLAPLANAPPGQQIAYGDDPLQFGELQLPPGEGPFPVVVFMHGGCWFAKYDIATTRSLAVALTKAGVAVWNLEYRRIGNAGGGWPGTMLDVAAATDHLRVLAQKYPIDLSRVIAMGHSAGGHLALWLGVRDKIATDSPLAAADPLPLAGIIALAPASELAKMHVENTCNKAATQLIGGSPGLYPDRYAAATPALMAPTDVPKTLILGAHDEIWTPIGKAYMEAARAAGDRHVNDIEVADAGHFELINPASNAFQIITEALREHLDDLRSGQRIP